ncbi:MAG: respiratory nitrate reductase subunit gamma [Deltaproteobacteria bacterium]|nr:respiratory nitrate reductase subunit gamma [Deltaproteobacteria bacterium]
MTFEHIIYGVYPYVAVILAISITIIRYTSNRFSFSALSSQFLENKKLFWGAAGWHYGIIFLFLGHLIGWWFPRAVLAWNGSPVRLYILEGAALAFALFALWGLCVLIVRRVYDMRVQKVTTIMDIILLFTLLAQVILGIYTAIFFRWGSNWFAGSMSPYLWSLVMGTPEIGFVKSMPFIMKLHIFGAYTIFLLIPFTRLVHFLSIPWQYFARPNQVVVWYSEPGQG